jgi:hypothetical protein
MPSRYNKVQHNVGVIYARSELCINKSDGRKMRTGSAVHLYFEELLLQCCIGILFGGRFLLQRRLQKVPTVQFDLRQLQSFSLLLHGGVFSSGKHLWALPLYMQNLLFFSHMHIMSDWMESGFRSMHSKHPNNPQRRLAQQRNPLERTWWHQRHQRQFLHHTNPRIQHYCLRFLYLDVRLEHLHCSGPTRRLNHWLPHPQLRLTQTNLHLNYLLQRFTLRHPFQSHLLVCRFMEKHDEHFLQVSQQGHLLLQLPNGRSQRLVLVWA